MTFELNDSHEGPSLALIYVDEVSVIQSFSVNFRGDTVSGHKCKHKVVESRCLSWASIPADVGWSAASKASVRRGKSSFSSSHQDLSPSNGHQDTHLAWFDCLRTLPISEAQITQLWSVDMGRLPDAQGQGKHWSR